MKLYIPLIILIFGFNSSLDAQQSERVEGYGFSMQKPENWIESQNMEIIKNLNRYDLKKKELQTLIASHNNSVIIASYYKYDQSQHSGLIPTVNILLRMNPNESFESFFNAISSSAQSMSSVFENLEFAEEPGMIELDGRQVVYFVVTYTMRPKKGKPLTIRSQNYAIPNGAVFYQVSFIDDSEDKNEDCSDLFKQLENSIRIAPK